MQLTFQSQLRTESDPTVIANLLRKGWVETVPPDFDATKQHAPKWVDGKWVVVDKTAGDLVAERKALYPDVEMYQVHEWMHDNDKDPASVVQIISAVYPSGKERKKALSRWDKAVRVPRDHPLVNVIGSQMGLTPEQIDAAWEGIGKL